MNILLQKLNQYKKKYYRNRLVRGVLLGGALVLTAYLFVNTLEFFGRFSPAMRGVLLFSFLGLTGYVLVQYIVDPLLKLNNLGRPMDNEEAARQIGRYFRDIDDKLLNTIQLQTGGAASNQLLAASIEQRTKQLSVVPFADAIDLRQNRRYLRYLVPPLLVILFISARFPKFFTDSSQRIVNFRKVYLPEAPFSFELKTNNLNVFKNEDITLNLRLGGQTLPETVYLLANGRRHKMTAADARNFTFTFNKIQKPFSFRFEAAGFESGDYQVNLIPRPNLEVFSATLQYPAYLGRVNESLNNVGNLLVPEGTRIKWSFRSTDTDSLLVAFGQGASLAAQRADEDEFTFSTKAVRSESYQVKLKNRYGFNKEDINYYLDVIPDQFPKVTLESFRDTTLFNYLVFGGNIADDYGFSKLSIVYEIEPADEEDTRERKGSIALPLQPRQTIQNYYHQWSLEKLKLVPGDKIRYFVQVWDNDGVNGAKSAKSAVFTFAVPSEQELEANQEQLSKQTGTQIGSALTKASKLKKEIDNLENRLKTKRQLDYQDKKQIEEVLKKRNELNQELEKLQQQLKSLSEQQNRFSEENPQLAEKMEQLQKLMDSLLDEETKKLYEELEKLLENNRNNFNLLDKLSQKENTLEKEIERALEMFKQLQFEQKLDKEINDLKKMAEEQEKLSEKTEEAPKQQSEEEQQQLQEQQEQLNEQFEQQKEDMKELEQMDKELEQPNGMEQMNEQDSKQQEISEKQKQSLEQMKNNQNKKASQNQKQAAQKMEQMAKDMEQMQGGMEMEQSQENLDDLRDILENLITLSFDQERLMKDFRNVNLSDPRFQKLSQEQLKLKDDAKIIEDSLYSLAKRVFQLESFVTREVTEMKGHMDESTRGIKERRIGLATGEQQLAMTSMNNLALMLNDALKQMQEQLAKAKAGMSKNPKPGKKQQPGLSQLQQQLNQRIQELKQSGKSGRQLSEELARMAAQQEMIRRALQEMEKMRDGKGEKPGGGLDELMKQMEETEKDLVNKNMSQEMIKRNQDIVTRLLESEKAQREREEDEERKAEQAKNVKPSVPPAFEQYIKNKEKQIELLKTIPPALSPYYRKEVDEYFKKLGDSPR